MNTNTSTNTQPAEILMPFGKHKNKPLRRVPTDYLGWLLGQPEVEPWLRDALRSEYKRRYDPGVADTKPSPSSTADPDNTDPCPNPNPPKPRYLPAGVSESVARQVIEAGRRALAKEYHPDLGGDPAVMAEVNGSSDWLLAQLPGLFEKAGVK